MSGSNSIPEQIFSNNDGSMTAGFNLTDQMNLVTSGDGYPQERVRNPMPTEMTEESRIYNKHRIVNTLSAE